MQQSKAVFCPISTALPVLLNCLRPLPACFDHAHGDGIELEGAVAVPLGALYPADRVGVGGGLQFPAGDATKVVRDHIMVPDAVAVAMDSIQEFDQLDRLDPQPGLFVDLADNAGGESFAQFQHSTGQRPLAFQRLASTAHQQHAAPIDDDRADSYQWGFGILSLHFASRADSNSLILLWCNFLIAQVQQVADAVCAAGTQCTFFPALSSNQSRGNKGRGNKRRGSEQRGLNGGVCSTN